MSAIGPPVGALELVVTIVAAWVALGALGLLRPHSLRFGSRLIFPAGACVALLLTVIAFLSLDAPPQSLVMPLGLPDLPFHVRLDPLSAFFLLLIGAASFGVSLFSAGYFRSNEGTPPGLICFQYHVFLAAMASVVIADDAYAFMVAWEAMALASYFLVTTEHRIPEIRRAGFLYLLIAHIGAIAILLCFGVLQADMKRLLAYSSVENIGIIVAGFGLTILFRAYGKNLLAAITLTAVLYHALNHAFFKTLLFLVTGSVLHATKERSLGKLGGLIHRMPWVAWLALIGTLAIAGLPPLNGFVSEWLLLQAFLFTPSLPQSFVNMLVPLAAAGVVLAVALAAYVMVKFYGVVFLGRPREAHLAYAHDAGRFERFGLMWLAAGCIVLGLLPVNVIQAIDPINAMLLNSSAISAGGGGNWLLLAPINADRSSYSPLIVLVVIVAIVLLTIRIVHRFYHGRIRTAPPWDCGFPLQTPRMQDSAEGFGQPIRQVFEPFFRIERHLPTSFDAAPRYFVRIGDPFWSWIFLPIAHAAEFAARIVGLIQQGRISVYLTYSFFTLLALLFFVR